MNTVEKRERSRLLANEVRAARARIKREIAVGTMDVAQLLMDPPPVCLNMKVAELLGALPRYGPTRVGRLLTSVNRVHGGAATKLMTGDLPLARLSDRQRQAIAEALA